MQNERAPLSIDEAATFTGLTKSYLYKLCHFGKISFFKPTGGKLYFRQEDLEAFIFRGRRAADYELESRAESLLNGSGA